MSKSISRHDLSEHLRHDSDAYRACVVNPPRGLSKLQPDTVDAMRSLLPAGRHYESHLLLQNGKGVDEHSHPEWVAIWYADPGEPPHPIIIEGVPVTPEPGECIVMPPGVKHHVDPYLPKHPRILFAVLVKEGET